MIIFTFAIGSPWKREWDSYWDKDFGRMFGHKHLEMQFMRSDKLVGIDLDISFGGCDHAGPSLAIMFLNHEFVIQLHDSRHWDYDKNTWEVPSEYYKDDHPLV
jgi:hypothetical protein